MSLLPAPGPQGFDETTLVDRASDLKSRYTAARPFPHIVLEDFLPIELLETVLQEFPDSAARQFDRAQEKAKSQYHPRACGPATRALFHELNSQAFLRFLSELTGITGLIPDPYFNGGGLHETKEGGKLGVHADFNIHPKMKLQRRLNLLIYLNRDWKEEYGGDLELWDRGMNACEVKVSPKMARAVIFNTDLDSFHGHPEPLTCPPDRSRRSIATYYYTAPEATTRSRTTNFRQRPGTPDKFAAQSLLKDIYLDWAPPAIQRFVNRK